MDTRKLFGTDLTVSRICFGTMTFGSQTDRAAAARMLDMCIDAGINFFDTANVYNAGESERITGELLGTRRRSVVLASKVGMRTGDLPAGLKRDVIVRAVEDTLARLGTDYLDLYYLHLPDWNTPVEESLEAMESLVREGKVRYPASSNYASWQVCRMLCLAEKNGYTPIRVTQPMYNLLARRLEDEYLTACRELGVSTVVYNPLAGGLLTGKHTAAAPVPGTRFDGNRMYLDRYWNDRNFEAVTELADFARRTGRSLVSVALNWLLHHTSSDCVILGASRVDQLEENLRAIKEGPLAPDTLEKCEQVWAMVKGAAPKYNR
jgi:aryl-alcohol dehydrogenase-like predicted oxidoreductase